MSYEIKYDELIKYPSSPYVDVQISNTKHEMYISKNGMIDTGAYITVIPECMVQQLNLKSSGIEMAGGFDSNI